MRIVLMIILWVYINPLASQKVFPLHSVYNSTKEPVKIKVKNELSEKSLLSSHMPKGKIYLVSVWASWCGSCRSELNALQKVHCDWSEKYDFEFIAISIDTPKDHPKIFNMVNKKNWNFKVVHDEFGYLVRELDIFDIPRMFLVDKEGNIVYEPAGYNSKELKKIEQKIKTL